MIGRTSFNAQFKAKVRQGMRDAVRRAAMWGHDGKHAKGLAYVHNRRGRTMLRIDYHYGETPAFRFWEQSRKDITAMTLEALGGEL